MKEDAFQILLAEAHTCSRIGLYQLLTDAGFVVAAEVARLDNLEPLLQKHKPPVLLLACSLLPENPVPFITGLRQQYPRTHIVLFLADCDTLPMPALAGAGIYGMVLQTESVGVIVRTIQAAAVGCTAFSQELLAKVMKLSPIPAPVTPGVPLTAPEQQLLQFLCAGKSNPEIAQTLNLSRKTVEKRLTALYKKLGVKTRAGAAAWYARRDK